MSRPIKQGLDYFPMDVEIDDKIELIEAKHGITGFGIIVKLFQRIYKEGYYLLWNEVTLLLFSKRINVDINKVSEVINDCLRYNIFDEKLKTKYNILTSTGIQKRFLNAVERRKSVELNTNYIIVDINSINVNINWINTDISTQSKVKESKVKESKENIDFDVFWDLYDKKIDKPKCEGKWNKLSIKVQKQILDYIPAYKKNQPDKQFRKNPETFLNNKAWENELLPNSVTPKQAFIPISERMMP